MSPPRTAAEARAAFTAFFEERGHEAVVAAGLVPVDPTVLFTIAGMVPFKEYFTGAILAPYRRATTVQPCIRTVDIDIVGTTTRHLTFFEMLGHFSFGDYFKAEAIPWAWELYTGTFGIDPDRLWVTVHETDDEAEKIWTDSVGFPAGRIQRMGEDNFWKMGETGPCGPCSEIYFDKGEAAGPGGGPAAGGAERYVEIGNLVFMQSERKVAGGELVPLAAPSIDFGGGLERLLPILQSTDSVFETDVLRPTVAVAEQVTGTSLSVDSPADAPAAANDARLCVMADHARAVTFVVADGIVPSNEGRGYVLRRLLRRVVMKAAQCGVNEPVMGELCRSVGATMGEAYPHVRSRIEAVVNVVEHEEEGFRRTLRAGMEILEEHLASAGVGSPSGVGAPPVPGDVAFLLHDTHGFPIDLTREVAAERGVDVDMEGFQVEMEGQKDRARRAAKGGGRAPAGAETTYRTLVEHAGTSAFVGYDAVEVETEVLAVTEPSALPERTTAGEELPRGRLAEVFLRSTPFYAESGGQVGDTGTIAGEAGRARVIDTTYAIPGLVRHLVVVEEGEILPGSAVRAEVDATRRDELRRNHTGTHLLHWALRQVLGEHVNQQGSLVAPDRLRFDFSHFAAVGPEEKARVEDLVNASVVTDGAVTTFETSKAEAMGLGAMAFFGDKYGERVRVVRAGSSIELCGGTHVGALGMIGPLRVVSEGSVGSGIRRIEAITGSVSLGYMRTVEERLETMSKVLRAPPDEAPEALERLVARLAEVDAELKSLKAGRRAEEARSLAVGAPDGIVVARLDERSADELRELAAVARGVPGMRAVVLAGSPDGRRVALVSAVPKGSEVTASDLIADAAKVVGGGAGRGGDLAVAGGKDASRIDEALAVVRACVSEVLGG